MRVLVLLSPLFRTRCTRRFVVLFFVLLIVFSIVIVATVSENINVNIVTFVICMLFLC